MGRPGSWWDNTWNPVGGCLPVSEGCHYCYAANYGGTVHTAKGIALYDGVTKWTRDGRAVFNGKLTVHRPDHEDWTWPLRWPGAKHPVMGEGQPSLIFVGDMSDVFIEERPKRYIDRMVFTLSASRHKSLLLTKRPDRMAEYFSAPLQERTRRQRQERLWLGFSAENQEWFDERWKHMRALAETGWTVFVSIAPMIGPVKLPPDFLAYGNRVWVIVGGEQRTNANHVPRPMDPDWARALRDQCEKAGVWFNLLQMSGRKDIPHDLFVRQFPPSGC